MAAETLIGGMDRGLEIVVADDDPNEQLLLSAAAQDMETDAHFEFVSDGQQLLWLLEQRAAAGDLPDLVVLDLRMPTMNGHQTLEALAHHKGFWEIPVLIWTSSADPDEPVRCWQEGAIWFERKPESFDGYVTMVQSLEERCRAARDAADPTIDWDEVLSAILARATAGPDRGG